MDPKKNPTANESPEKTEKWRHSLITNCLAQMGTAMGKEVPKERVLLYCRALNNLGEAELRFAFDRALEHLGEFLPSIEQLRTYAEQYFEATRERHLREHAQLLLMRPNTHPDFIGKSELELKREFQRIVLESKASGAWGKELIEPAKTALAAMDRGETVQTPYSVHGLMSEVYGRPTR